MNQPPVFQQKQKKHVLERREVALLLHRFLVDDEVHLQGLPRAFATTCLVDFHLSHKLGVRVVEDDVGGPHFIEKGHVLVSLGVGVHEHVGKASVVLVVVDVPGQVVSLFVYDIFI